MGIELKKTLIPIEQVAELLDLTVRRVQQLSAKGIIPKTIRNRYELTGCVQGYVRFLRARSHGQHAPDGEDMVNSKARLADTRAKIEELKRARLAGEMIPRDQVMRAWTEPAMAMRSHLLSIPTKVAARVGMCKSAVEVQALLRKEIEDALGELSKVSIIIEGPAIDDVANGNASGLGDDLDGDIPDAGAAPESLN